jgi:hypothetical protein
MHLTCDDNPLNRGFEFDRTDRFEVLAPRKSLITKGTWSTTPCSLVRRIVRSSVRCRAAPIKKGKLGDIPGTRTGAVGAVVCGRVFGGDTQHVQIPLGRGVGEQDAVMSRQPASSQPRWRSCAVLETAG